MRNIIRIFLVENNKLYNLVSIYFDTKCNSLKIKIENPSLLNFKLKSARERSVSSSPNLSHITFLWKRTFCSSINRINISFVVLQKFPLIEYFHQNKQNQTTMVVLIFKHEKYWFRHPKFCSLQNWGEGVSTPETPPWQRRWV